MATMQHKILCVREFIKTGSATAVQRAFTNLSKEALCVKTKTPAILLSTDVAARLCELGESSSGGI
jgi:hypothetical protein